MVRRMADWVTRSVFRSQFGGQQSSGASGTTQYCYKRSTYHKSANVSSGARVSIQRILLIVLCLALTGCDDSKSTQTQAIDTFPIPDTWFEIERETVGESGCTPPFCSYRTQVVWATQDIPTINLLREDAQQAHWTEFRIEWYCPDDIPYTTTPFCDIRAKHSDIELELLVGRR